MLLLPIMARDTKPTYKANKMTTVARSFCHNPATAVEPEYVGCYSMCIFRWQLQITPEIANQNCLTIKCTQKQMNKI